MKEKKIFTAKIVATGKDEASKLESILKKEKISFFKETGFFDFVEFNCNLSWMDVKRLIKLDVLNLEEDINLRSYYKRK